MTPGTGWIPDDAFLDRVKRAYRLANESFGVSRLSVWRKILARQKQVHEALIEKSNKRLRAIFSDPASTDLFYGVDNLCKAIVSLSRAHSEDGELRDLQMLAQLTGINHDGPTDILLELDQALGHSVSFANPFQGEVGLTTQRGVAAYRAIQALYQAYRIRQIARDGAKVLEIGPGVGRTALYCFNAGIKDYTTLDLPMGMVAQACFLGATIGPSNIWMIGDDGSNKNKIKILPCKMLGKLIGRFDVVFNADSMVEMSPFQILSYLRFIRRHADIFLSINHENRKVKVKHFAAIGLFGRKKTRSSYGMRAGYFEEVFT